MIECPEFQVRLSQQLSGGAANLGLFAGQLFAFSTFVYDRLTCEDVLKNFKLCQSNLLCWHFRV